MRFAALLLVGLVSMMGCQAIVCVDRDLIPSGNTTGGGNGGVGGIGGAGGNEGGGGGGPIPCSTVNECPGVDDECQNRTCDNNECGTHYAPNNKLVMNQTASDCKKRICDGQGSIVAVNDDSDLFDDGNECSADYCLNGMPVNEILPGTACMTGGGLYCDATGNCVECLVGGDCPLSGVCDAMTNVCVAATCMDGASNGNETDVDCGGSCPPCADLLLCNFGSDCQSGICQVGKCKVPTCTDSVDNGSETDVDCGGPTCPKCPTGDGCLQDSDCLSNLCSGTTCLPSCTDLAKNNDETDVDCGGATCPACGTGKMCMVASDCASGVCTNGTCAPPVCGDGITNGNEQCDDANMNNTDSCLSTCVLASCGDGFVYAGVEPCDDGDADNTDACLVGCIVASCGDGFVRFGVETCDDGNTIPGDGCSATCFLESCGDGDIDPGETCDDGNMSSDDACLATCQPASCGDGFVWVGMEVCDDGDMFDNDGCSAVCMLEPPYTCMGTPSVCTSPVELNCNDGADNDGDMLVDCADSDCALGCNPNVGPCPIGDTMLVYTSTDVPKSILDLQTVQSNTNVGGLGLVSRVVAQVDITHTYDGDIDMSLISPGGASADLSSDNGGTNENFTGTIFNSACATPITSGVAPYTGCFAPEANLNIFNGGPSKGTWKLSIYDDAGGDTGTINAWRLALCVAPTLCGNGVANAGEACDDGNNTAGDGCDGACVKETGYNCVGSPSVCTPICGDGVVVGMEPCDDGNLNNGDGCSDVCVKEAGYFCIGSPSVCVFPGETEPNNTFVDADARALDPVPVLITGDVVFAGSISPIGDVDKYKMVLAADSTVRFETFDSTGGDCQPTTITTLLRLYNAAQTQIYSDTLSGISNCSSIVANLAAGTYYVHVEESGNNAMIANYRLEVNVQENKGTEMEINDSQIQANLLDGSNVYISGDHQLNADIDFFSVTVPMNGMSILAEIIETAPGSPGYETCESLGISSRLTLFNDMGVQLALDTIDGRGNCSKMDGKGTTPMDTGAKNLAAGTYYLRVDSTSATASGVFNYRLVVAIR